MNNNITETFSEVLPSKVTSLGVSDFKKNDYRSVVSITFISNIVFYMVATSICNKDNG